MEIRDLKTFLKIAELMNFTRAAEVLGYAQSSVSAQIRALEREIGAPLFNRIGKNISLTQFGEALLPYARSVVSLSLQMQTIGKEARDLGGTIRIGMVESLFSCIMEEALLAYHQDYPKVKIEVNVDATVTLKKLLGKGLLDAACVIDDPRPGEDWQDCFSVETDIVAVASAAHPLAGQSRVKPEDLRNQPFILMEDTAPYCIQFYRLAAPYFVPQAFLKLQNADMACRLVRNSRNLSVLPRYTVSPYLERGELVILPVPELAQRQAIRLILHPGKVVAPQVSGFLSALKKRLSAEEFARRLNSSPAEPGFA